MFAVGADGEGEDVGLEEEGLGGLGAGEDVPDADGVVPATAYDDATVWREGEGGDGAFVSGELVEELAGLHGPDVDVEGVVGGGADDLAGGVDGEAGEGEAGGGCECSEVAVADEVPGADGAVEGGGEQDLAAFGKLAGGDGGGVLGEGYDAEAGLNVPDFDFAVVGGGDDLLAVGGVDEGVDGVEVALLLEDVGFRLPFPYQELAELGGAEGEPFSGFVDGDEVYVVL